jgi:dTDP-4-dehydrorhamnose 3,5-epimerase
MFEPTSLEGLLIYSPRVHQDIRGYFLETFNQKHFKERGLPCDFIQDNASYSVKGTIRGIHLQKAPFAQTKLIGVTQGSIFDVAVDLRPDSKTYGKWFGLTLTENDHKYLYIPSGFGHGFMALSDGARVSYKVDNSYNKEAEAGVRFDDPAIGIQWPQIGETLLSDKDRELPLLKDFRPH